MICGIRFALPVLLAGMLLQGATLERLGLEDMAQKSTAIVRARVTGTYAAPQGALIYTHYRLRVEEVWKGTDATQLDVVVPGGVASGLRQSFSGVPTLSADRDYVLFLWTGPSGLTHIIGLSQGIFEVSTSASGQMMANRAATTEMMLDSKGRSVHDRAVSYDVKDLHSRVSRAIAGGSAK